jgi:hypothetical protein
MPWVLDAGKMYGFPALWATGEIQPNSLRNVAEETLANFHDQVVARLRLLGIG